jgi:hypothetical protein
MGIFFYYSEKPDESPIKLLIHDKNNIIVFLYVVWLKWAIYQMCVQRWKKRFFFFFFFFFFKNNI